MAFDVMSMVNAKGGPGKTTVAQILISAALASKRQVVFFDGDPTANLMEWMEAAIEAGNWTDNCQGYRVTTVQEIIDALNDLLDKDFDGLVFVDTPGVGDISTLTMISNSDFVVIPTSLGTASVRTTLATAKAIGEYVDTLPDDRRPVVKIVRNNLPRQMTKAHWAVYDKLSDHPYCAKAGISNHSVVETWDAEGPLLTRYKRAASGKGLSAVHSKSVLKVLEDGLGVINELFEEADADE
ncbi:Cellulose biosynthesis protein BcsQ [Palleronia marisminoris]|uniref:nucleotide-binding protein n=1 Tax=Palleronia marisminoris TaxID=315423 RepID=UPI0008E5EEC1|nr:hypothetical protein [Palleronia marisminoris]SFH28129.1 Cellulose biosynthesis protein BcsQ [Palleronia marisminoris]